MCIYCQLHSEISTVYVQGYLTGKERPKHTQITRIIEGFETLEFRSYFDKWPLNGQHPVSEEGRGKVAGMLNILILLPGFADHTYQLSLGSDS